MTDRCKVCDRPRAESAETFGAREDLCHQGLVAFTAEQLDATSRQVHNANLLEMGDLRAEITELRQVAVDALAMWDLVELTTGRSAKYSEWVALAVRARSAIRAASKEPQ